MTGIKAFLIILTMFLLLIFSAQASQHLDLKQIRDGSSWDIGGGYYIKIEDVDYEGKLALITIRKEGDVLKDALLQPGEKFEYTDSSDTLIVSMKLDSIFRGMDAKTCQFTDIYLRYGEPKTSPSLTSTPVNTATPVETALPRSTVDVDFGSGALIPGLSPQTIMILLILAVVSIKRKKPF